MLVAVGRLVWDAQFGQYCTGVTLEAVESLRVGILTLAMRLQGWVSALVSGQPVYEPVGSALVWGLIICLIATWATWKLRRDERAFDAVLPIAIFLALVIAYSGRAAWVMFVLLAVWLGLMVVVPWRARYRQLGKRSGLVCRRAGV